MVETKAKKATTSASASPDDVMVSVFEPDLGAGGLPRFQGHYDITVQTGITDGQVSYANISLKSGTLFYKRAITNQITERLKLTESKARFRTYGKLSDFKTWDTDVQISIINVTWNLDFLEEVYENCPQADIAGAARERMEAVTDLADASTTFQPVDLKL